MPALKSSNLAFADYDEAANSLTITFKNGGTYVYADVPETVYEELLAAPSPGSYLAANIRDKFSFTKG